MSSVVPPYIPPPPGLNYISSMRTSYTFVLISLPLSSILIPILLLILFFSTPNSRKTCLFALNVIIVLLGIVEGVLSTVVQSIIILHPQYQVSDRLYLSYIGIALYTPILVDCILILRLSAVYPANITPKASRITVLAVPLLCTVARIVCVTLFVREWAILGRRTSATMASDVVWPRNPRIIADWSIQLFESFYCSAFFLNRLRDHKALSSRMYRQQSIAARLRAVFYIAITNFCFPALLSIFQLFYVIHERSVTSGAIVLMINNYISIIGVVFCTLWCASDVWRDTRNFGASYSNYQETAFRQSAITLSGIAPNLNLSPTGPRFTPTLDHTSSQSHDRPLSSALQYGEDHKDMVVDPDVGVDAESGLAFARTFARNLNSNASNPYMQALTLHRMPGDTDQDQSSDSHSPITPHDVRVIISSKTEKSESRWETSVTPPRAPHSIRGGSHLDVVSSLSGSDIDMEMDFATPSPSQRHRPFIRSSLSLSDFSDYQSRRDPIRNRNAPDVNGTPISAEDESEQNLDVRNCRRPSPSSSENDSHLSPFVDDARLSRSRANRPSLSDWSDARPGGGGSGKPSWDGRSHGEP